MTEGQRLLRRIGHQQRIADRCQVSQQQVSNWMRGVCQPNEERKRILEEEFGVPAESWLREADFTKR